MINGGLTARRAAINIGFTAGNSLCVWTAAGIAALTTLCLGENAVYLLDNRVTFDLELL